MGEKVHGDWVRNDRVSEKGHGERVRKDRVGMMGNGMGIEQYNGQRDGHRAI